MMEGLITRMRRESEVMLLDIISSWFIARLSSSWLYRPKYCKRQVQYCYQRPYIFGDEIHIYPKKKSFVFSSFALHVWFAYSKYVIHCMLRLLSQAEVFWVEKISALVKKIFFIKLFAFCCSK